MKGEPGPDGDKGESGLPSPLDAIKGGDKGEPGDDGKFQVMITIILGDCQIYCLICC